MPRSAMSVWFLLFILTVCVCSTALSDSYPSDRQTSSKQHLLHFAKVLNTLRKLELVGKGTLSHGVRNGRYDGSRVRKAHRSHETTGSRSTLSNEKKADTYKSLESLMMTSQDVDDPIAKRQGNWDYDYGLGGGRFGKRNPGDYGIGGGRFGRDVSDVDHVDLSDAE